MKIGNKVVYSFVNIGYKVQLLIFFYVQKFFLLLFKKMFLIMLINFFGDDFGIMFELMKGFFSVFYCFGFRGV